MPAITQTENTMNSGRIEFPKGHQRITPRTNDELMACEPAEIAQMIFVVRNSDWLYRQIQSKTWKQIIRKVDKYDLRDPGVYIPSNLLSQWVDFLSRILMWREDAYEVTAGNSLTREKRDRQKLISKLTKTVAFGLYMQRDQVVRRFAQANRLPQELLDPSTASIEELLEAWRWCQAYAVVFENPALGRYCESVGISQESIASLSYLQLTELMQAIGEFTSRQRLVRAIYQQFPNYLDLLGSTPQYTYLYTTPLENVSLPQLSSLFKELEAMAEAKIGYDDNGGMVALS